MRQSMVARTSELSRTGATRPKSSRRMRNSRERGCSSLINTTEPLDGGATHESSAPSAALHLSRLVLPSQPLAKKNISLSFRHIVSAVDFTVASAVAVRTVLDLIRRTGARLTLVHALKNIPITWCSRAAKRLKSQGTCEGRPRRSPNVSGRRCLPTSAFAWMHVSRPAMHSWDSRHCIGG